MSQTFHHVQPLERGLYSQADDSTAAINNLEMVIGRLPDSVRNDYTHQQSRTHSDLTELLLARASPIVTQQITGLLLNTYVSPLTTFLLPMRQLQPYESINVRWMEINFDQGLAPQVEVEGLGRLYTHNKTERGARAVRRGLAVKIETGFYMTPDGREEWAMQIQQLATIVQRTNEYDIMMTLLQTPWQQNSHADELGGSTNSYSYGKRHSLTFAERLALEVDWFGIVNKAENSRGFQCLCTNMRTAMKENGVEPDALVVPPNLLGHYLSSSDMREYSSIGPQAVQNREQAAELAPDSGIRLQTFQGMKLVDAHITRMTDGEHERSSDLLTVPKQIGEYYPMLTSNAFMNNADFQSFQSRHRAIRIMNEDHGRLVPVKFSDCIQHSMRFEDTGVLADAHNDEMVLASGDLFNKFEYDNDGKSKGTAKVWGDMTVENLTNDSIDNVVSSIVGKLGDGMYNALTLALGRYMGASPDQDTKTAVENNLYKFVSAAMPDSDLTLALFKTALGANGVDGLSGIVTAALGRDRMKSLVDRKPALERAIVTIFLTSKITRRNMLTMDRSDFYIPVDFVLCRPYMTYNVSSAIMMKAGRDTGETIVGNQRFQMTSNISDSTLLANYFYYGKAMVKKPRNVMVAPSVFIQSYVRGNNTAFIDTEDLDTIRNTSGLLEGSKSIYAFMTRVDDPVDTVNVIDIRGNHPGLTTMPNGKSTFYASSAYYNNLLNIDVSGLADNSGSFVDYEDVNLRPNSICHLGHVETANGTVLYRNTGHLGSITYDGVEKSRKKGYFSPIQAAPK